MKNQLKRCLMMRYMIKLFPQLLVHLGQAIYVANEQVLSPKILKWQPIVIHKFKSLHEGQMRQRDEGQMRQRDDLPTLQSWRPWGLVQLNKMKN